MTLTVACGGGVFAADKAGRVKPAAAAVTAVNLAGRWTGQRLRHDIVTTDPLACGDKPCELSLGTLTYDIVPCPGGWCGIVVTAAAPCGVIGLRLNSEHPKGRPETFNGKLELAKGSAPYTVEAWYHSDAASDSPAGSRPDAVGQRKDTLNFVGDTGSGLLLMRRSFPFQAELARMGDAGCTLDKATS